LEVKFEGASEPIIYKIPRILSEKKIKALKNRIAFNRNWNRKDAKNKYLLTGFIRCGECGKTLVGQTMKSDHGKFDYQYYRDLDGKYRKCRAFSSIKTEKIEDAVFKTSFENTMDEIDSDDWDPPEWIKKIIEKAESETFKTNHVSGGHRNIQDFQRGGHDGKGSGPDYPAPLSKIRLVRPAPYIS
jgi:site-specific DNA recombinase